MSALPTWMTIALTLAIDAAAGLAGGLLSPRWLARRTLALVGFAAGALLAAAFLDALPEATARLGPSAASWAFGGFVAAALLEWAIGGHGHGGGAPSRQALPVVLLAADALHNVVDGAAIAAAWLVSPRAGLATAIAVVAHEVPQEVGDFALLAHAGWSRRRALAALFLVQLTSVAGALGVAAAARTAEMLANVVVAVASGSFLYIGATDLLPELRAQRRGRLIGVGFVAGAAVVALAGRLTR